jgi:hypothetical protein
VQTNANNDANRSTSSNASNDANHIPPSAFENQGIQYAGNQVGANSQTGSAQFGEGSNEFGVRNQVETAGAANQFGNGNGGSAGEKRMTMPLFDARRY